MLVVEDELGITRAEFEEVVEAAHRPRTAHDRLIEEAATAHLNLVEAARAMRAADDAFTAIFGARVRAAREVYTMAPDDPRVGKGLTATPTLLVQQASAWRSEGLVFSDERAMLVAHVLDALVAAYDDVELRRLRRLAKTAKEVLRTGAGQRRSAAVTLARSQTEALDDACAWLVGEMPSDPNATTDAQIARWSRYLVAELGGRLESPFRLPELVSGDVTTRLADIVEGVTDWPPSPAGRVSDAFEVLAATAERALRARRDRGSGLPLSAPRAAEALIKAMFRATWPEPLRSKTKDLFNRR